jgi:hypothetical protein
MNILVYLIICFVVGLLGQHRSIGFVGFFLISLFLTPIVSLVILLLAVERKPAQNA